MFQNETYSTTLLDIDPFSRVDITTLYIIIPDSLYFDPHDSFTFGPKWACMQYELLSRVLIERSKRRITCSELALKFI